MKKIGLLMGCFNPIHNDHLGLAQHVLNEGIVQEIWIIPSKENINIKDKKPISGDERVKILDEIIDDYPNFKIIPLEIKAKRQYFTYETLSLLNEPNIQLYLIIGSDNLISFNKWKRYEDILQNYHLIVSPRDDEDIEEIINGNPKLKKYGHKIIKANYQSKNISSTFIRNNIANEELIKKLLPSKIYEYIKRNNLYKEVKK